MIQILKKLTQTYGVSGNEEIIREVIKDEIRDKVDELFTDALGNLIAIKKGTGKKIMVAAHMDEIGIIITHIDDNGFLRFSNIGGVSSYNSLGQKVIFKNGTIGAISYENKMEDMKNLKLNKMYVDIGEDSRENALKKVKIGDTACFEGDFVSQGRTVISKALDDRIGCAILIKSLINLQETDNEIYFVFTVQEELGLRGAKTAAYNINPDMAIAIDVTSTGDTPESKLMEVKLGKGPAIKIKDSSILCHQEVKKLLEDSANKLNIPYQYEILESGGTDVGAIHLTAGGVVSGAISIPCRYIHSPVEMISLDDAENAVKLLIEAIRY